MTRYEIRSADSLVIFTFAGQSSAAESFELLRQYLADADCVPTFNCVVDVRLLEKPFSTAEIRSVCDRLIFHADAFRPRRLAIVTTTDVLFGMSRMFESMSEGLVGFETRVFREISPALAWASKPSPGPPEEVQF